MCSAPGPTRHLGPLAALYPEMPVSKELVHQAAEHSQSAVVVIGRSSGEDRENALEKGSFYLTDAERTLLTAVTAQFNQTAVLLNIGSVMDFPGSRSMAAASAPCSWYGKAAWRVAMRWRTFSVEM